MKLPAPVAAFFAQPNPVRPGSNTLDYFCELIVINDGKSEVTQIGNVRPDSDSPYKRKGLSPAEAFHLTQLVNFLKGILFALGSQELEFEILEFVRREVEHRTSGSKIYVPTGQEVNEYSTLRSAHVRSTRQTQQRRL